MYRWLEDAVKFDERWKNVKSFALLFMLDGNNIKYCYYVDNYNDIFCVFYVYIDNKVSNSHAYTRLYKGIPGVDVFISYQDALGALEFRSKVNKVCDRCKYDYLNITHEYSCDNCSKKNTKECPKPDFLSSCRVTLPYNACSEFLPLNVSQDWLGHEYDFSSYYEAIMACENHVNCPKINYQNTEAPNYIRPSNIKPNNKKHYIKIEKEIDGNNYICLYPLDKNSSSFKDISPDNIIFDRVEYWVGKRKRTLATDVCNKTLKELLEKEENGKS